MIVAHILAFSLWAFLLGSNVTQKLWYPPEFIRTCDNNLPAIIYIVSKERFQTKQLWEFNRQLFGNMKRFHIVDLDVSLNGLLCSAPFHNSRHSELAVELVGSTCGLRWDLAQVFLVWNLAANWTPTLNTKGEKTALPQTANENTPRFCYKTPTLRAEASKTLERMYLNSDSKVRWNTA